MACTLRDAANVPKPAAASSSRAAELLTNRLADLHRIAGQKGTLASQQPKGKDAATAVKPSVIGAPVGKSSIKDFFHRHGEICAELARGRANVKQMGQMLEEILGVTTQAKEKAINERLADLVKDTNGVVANVKKRIEELQAQSKEMEIKAGNTPELQIRRNMQQSLVRKHQAVLMDFQRAQANFKDALEKRQLRELQILVPDAAPEQVAQMLEAGETASMQVAKKMLGTHAELLDELARIRAKHEDILRLEKSIAALAQMFQEMAVLVEHQGEMIDSIEVHIHQANEYTAKAAKELTETKKVQRNTRKWMLCLTCIMGIILAIILGGVILAAISS